MAVLSSPDSLRLLLSLVRCALWNARPDESELALLKSMDGTQWESLLDCARKQTVVGLLYQALVKLSPDVAPPEGLTLSLLSELNRIVLTNRRIWKTEDDVCALFRSASLRPVPMKGHLCARRYPWPELRESGDIDLYFPSEEFQAALDAVSAAGIDMDLAPDGSARYRVDGTDIDLHPRYFDLYAEASSLPDIPSPEAELLMLSAHILKHAAGPGLGLRQICDYALALKTFQGSRARLDAIFRELGLEKWNNLLQAFISDYLDSTPGSATRRSRPLFRLVCNGGNFGHHAPSRVKNAGRSAWISKADTLGRMLLRLPFSLRYAPCFTCSRFRELISGDLSGRKK